MANSYATGDDGKSKAKVALAAGLLVVAVILLWLFYPAGRRQAVGEGQRQAFYSDDDGATWFADAADRLPPFDHDGKPAFSAFVYECDGKPFVNHLERYTPEGRAVAEAARKPGARPPTGGRDMMVLLAKGREVKRPGGPKWVNKADAAAAADITTPRCPDGAAATPTAVAP